MDCIFCKIGHGEIPLKKVYEDDLVFIIEDIAPQANKHYLMITKEHIKDVTKLNDVQAIMLGKALRIIAEKQEELGLQNGFRIVTNVGDDGRQSVKHLHLHILGGEKLSERMA